MYSHFYFNQEDIFLSISFSLSSSIFLSVLLLLHWVFHCNSLWLLCTKARVKMVFTPSILKRLLNSLSPNNCNSAFLFLFSIKLFGIWDLGIHLTRFSNICFLMPNLIWISVPLWILIVHTICMGKCTTYHFLNLFLMHLLPLS